MNSNEGFLLFDPHRSFEIPSKNPTTQGKTLICNFSTNQGTLATLTFKKRVEKYLDASS
jgi:hypothetical protein